MFYFKSDAMMALDSLFQKSLFLFCGVIPNKTHIGSYFNRNNYTTSEVIGIDKA